MTTLSPQRIARAIYPAGFYRVKAKHILGICRDLLRRYGGKVPAREEDLLALRGVGRKTANLVLGHGFGLSAICVDTHVHRISNRLGTVRTRSPEETETVLRDVLPRRLWTGWNHLLVEFGKAQCTPLSPRCGRCPLAGVCLRRGVGRSR